MPPREESNEFRKWSEDLRKRLRAARESLGLSVREAQDRTGVAFGTINKIETGSQDATVRVIVDLAVGYGCDPAMFLTGMPGRLKVGPPAGAGSPVDSETAPDEYLDLTWIYDDTVPVRVVGNSMIAEHIVDGDYVIIEPNPTPDNGAIVVAYNPDHGHVLKRYKKMANGEQRLCSRNDIRDYWVINDSRDRIIGVYRGLIRTEG